MTNYWGGEVGSPINADLEFTKDNPVKQDELEVSKNNETETRSEKLREAREAVIGGCFLYLLDPVDISKCKTIETGAGPFEVVFQDTVVGYARDKIFFDDFDNLNNQA
jgi:hypothetical protein